MRLEVILRVPDDGQRPSFPKPAVRAAKEQTKVVAILFHALNFGWPSELPCPPLGSQICPSLLPSSGEATLVVKLAAGGAE